MPGPACPAGGQAGAGVRRPRHHRGAAGLRRRTGRRAREGAGRAPGVDRAGAGAAVDLAGPARRPVAAPAHRPAAVRGQRWGAGPGAARRTDPGGAAGGEPDRQLQPGRWLQGHLGADLLAGMGRRSRRADGVSCAGGRRPDAWQNAGSAREALSAEIWECLNSTHNSLPARVAAARDFGPAPFFSYVRERAANVAGYVEASMSRDTSYDALILGRSLERVGMTERRLAARISAAR